MISSRGTDGIVVVDVASGDKQFVLGGEFGTVPLVDFDGTTHPAGATLWRGQHNVEYVGEHEYNLFDNEFDTGNNSRLLSVTYDPATMDAAVLTWHYELPGYSEVFGDHDQLPTGNRLGVYWPQYVYEDEDDGPQYDALYFEVVHGAATGAIASQTNPIPPNRSSTTPAQGEPDNNRQRQPRPSRGARGAVTPRGVRVRITPRRRNQRRSGVTVRRTTRRRARARAPSSLV